MKNAVVCAGGPASEVIDLTKFPADETVFIGADRGALYLLEKGIIPQEAVGDFDSVSKEEYALIKASVDLVGQFRSEKNETDTELAVVRALSYRPKQIILTGVTGGRLDHMESALHLLYRLQMDNPHIAMSIRNQTNHLAMLPPGEHMIELDKQLPYVSLFPFQGPVTALTMKGFKYETLNEVLEIGMTRFTSNEPLASICTISFREGICLMVRSSDA